MYRVLVVEDNEETRRNLVENIEASDAFTVLAWAESVAGGLRALFDQPDILLVDLGLPDGNGHEVIRAAQKLQHVPEVMVISVFGDEQNVISAIEAGATGYLLKDASRDDITKSLVELMDGGSPITPSIARHILRRFSTHDEVEPEPAKAEATNTLTAREIDVLELVARGYKNSEIAELLHVSYHTVTSHIKKIYTKLAVRSRSEAIFEANQLGILGTNNHSG